MKTLRILIPALIFSSALFLFVYQMMTSFPVESPFVAGNAILMIISGAFLAYEMINQIKTMGKYSLKQEFVIVISQHDCANREFWNRLECPMAAKILELTGVQVCMGTGLVFSKESQHHFGKEIGSITPPFYVEDYQRVVETGNSFLTTYKPSKR